MSVSGAPRMRSSSLGLSLRVALAALLLYVAIGLAVAVPPGDNLWPVLVAGVLLLALALRSGRAVLLGPALALPVLGWTVRAARGDGGSGVGALELGLALTVVVLLARVALDAAPRGGPVRIDPIVQRHLVRDAAAVCGLGLTGGAIVLAVAGRERRAPVPSLLLPLGVLAVPVLIGFVAAMVALVRKAEQDAGARQRRRWLAAALLVAVIALPLVAGLGARAPLPPSGPTPAEAVGSAAATPATDPGLGSTSDRQPPDVVPAIGAGSRVAFLALAAGIGLLAAVLLGGGERLVPTDDRRPDRSPPDEVLHGAPAAPTIELLPREELAHGFDAALLQLRDELDVRLAVRCAYASVAAGLGRHEHARLPAESELEFLERQLRLLGAGGPALQRLTDLFELARFSEHTIDEDMRAAAAAALADVRRALVEDVPAGGGARPAR
jgi:hypothetical protein